MEAIRQAGPNVTSVRVSKRTYAQLLIDLDHRLIDLNDLNDLNDHPNPSLATSGVTAMANFAGLNIYLSSFLQDGMMSLFNGDALVDVVSLEATPAKPLDPDVRLAAIVQDEMGAWVALDADGGVLWHLTEKGARDLSEQKGVPLSTR